MTEKINPDIIGFIGEKEDRLTEYLLSIAEPYGAMVSDAMQQYESAMDKDIFAQLSDQLVFDAAPDLDTIKQSKGLALPTARANMHYSAHIKTEAVVRLGMFSIVSFFRRAFNKPTVGRDEQSFRALKKGIARMKRETEHSLVTHFMDYRENIKFQYLLPLIDAAGSRMFESLTDRFNGYMTNLQEITQSIGEARGDKETVKAQLKEIDHTITDVLKPRIDDLRQSVNQMRENNAGNEEEHHNN